MGFPRRRSLWLKVAVLAAAVWVTVCFLLYTEDRAAAAAVQGLAAPSGVAVPQQPANGFVPPAAPFRKETTGSVLGNKPKVNQAGPEQGNLRVIFTNHFVNILWFILLHPVRFVEIRLKQSMCDIIETGQSTKFFIIRLPIDILERGLF